MDAVQGRVIQFDTDAGYGFIRADEVDGDVFFHVNDVVGGNASLRVGSAIECDVVEGDRGWRATEVEVLVDEHQLAVSGDLSNRLTEALLGADPTLTAAQILAIRQAVVALLDDPD